MLSEPAMDLQKMPILTKKKSSFQMKLILISIRKQVKLSHLGHRKSARIHWKTDAPKTCHCLVRILVLRHNWAIFLRKWAISTVSIYYSNYYRQWRSLSGHVERIFVHKNWREGYWHYLVATGWRYTRCFVPCFLRSHYQPQSWYRLATSELRLDTVGLLFVGCHQR